MHILNQALMMCITLMIIFHYGCSGAGEDSKLASKHIEAAIIVDRHSSAARYAVRHNHVSAFKDHFIKGAAEMGGFELLFAEWPPVFTHNCPKLPGHPEIAYRAEGPTKHPDGFERGLLLAHKEIYEDFVWRAEQGSAPFDDGSIIVFEDDVYPRVEDYAEQALKIAANMTEMGLDLLFLGWCYADMRQKLIPPFCTHAYVVSLSGARKLVENSIPCGPSIDVQFIGLAKAGILKWDYAPPASYAHQIAGNGKDTAMGKLLAIGDDSLVGDGMFAQRVFA